MVIKLNYIGNNYFASGMLYDILSVQEDSKNMHVYVASSKYPYYFDLTIEPFDRTAYYRFYNGNRLLITENNLLIYTSKQEAINAGKARANEIKNNVAYYKLNDAINSIKDNENEGEQFDANTEFRCFLTVNGHHASIQCYKGKFIVNGEKVDYNTYKNALNILHATNENEVTRLRSIKDLVECYKKEVESNSKNNSKRIEELKTIISNAQKELNSLNNNDKSKK